MKNNAKWNLVKIGCFAIYYVALIIIGWLSGVGFGMLIKTIDERM